MGDLLRDELNEIAARGSAPLNFRGVGSMMSPYLVEKEGEHCEGLIMKAFVLFALLKGVFLGSIALINLSVAHESGDTKKLARTFEEFIGQLREWI